MFTLFLRIGSASGVVVVSEWGKRGGIGSGKGMPSSEGVKIPFFQWFQTMFSGSYDVQGNIQSGISNVLFKQGFAAATVLRTLFHVRNMSAT